MITDEARRQLVRRFLESMAGCRKDVAIEPGKLSEEFGMSDKTVRNILGECGGFHTWNVNPFCTDFHFQYFIDVKLNMATLRGWFTDKAKEIENRSQRPSANSRPVGCLMETFVREGKPIEAFIEWIIQSMASNERYGGNIIVRNAYIIHGSRERDLSLMVYTNDGLKSIGAYIRNVLSIEGLSFTVTCTEVGWNRGYNAVGGERATIERSGNHDSE